MSVDVISLGCRLNLSESESMRGILAAADDLIVINSCAVTAEALSQTRQAIRRARRDRPDARLLVTGCAAEIDRAAIAAMPEVDGLIANAAKLDPRAWNIAPPNLTTYPSLLPREGGGLLRHSTTHTRAFIAVQNGCDHACTFCVIPQGRGPSRSKSQAAIIAEITQQMALGTCEMVLTGVDLTAWGADLSGAPKLGSLVSAILTACPTLPRLRLSSVDAAEIDPELAELFAHEPRLMPHIHLSLQHGDDLILKRMKRRHMRDNAVKLVAKLRDKRPDLAVGADLIAGFPTEDDAAHAQNISLIRELPIVHAHIFPFSARAHTPAARMPQHAKSLIKSRAADLRAVAQEVRNDWLNSLIGHNFNILSERDGTGHAENFARIRLPANTPAGRIINFTPTQIIDGYLA
jgi:threonylcarbamoyladenosine tRNA methylthiotransferase MtaB